jgi:hypothetical protein
MNKVQLVISAISYSKSQTGAYALILAEINGDRRVPIVIGAFEAQSIAIALDQDISPPRPLTHDLFVTFCNNFSVEVKEILIHKLEDSVFFSSIIFETEGKEQMIDSRTSDAIAIAVRLGVPIYTYEDILDKTGLILEEPSSYSEEDEMNEMSELEEVARKIQEEAKTQDQEKSQKSDFSTISDDGIQKMLKTAIAKEDYEQAARLRDELQKRGIE